MDKVPIGHCESCGKPLCEGDTGFYTSDGVVLCADHSPTLVDVIEHQKSFIDDFEEYGYETREKMQVTIAEHETDLAKNGNRSMAYVL